MLSSSIHLIQVSNAFKYISQVAGGGSRYLLFKLQVR